MIWLNDKKGCCTRLSVVVSLSAAIVIILPPGLRTPRKRVSVSPDGCRRRRPFPRHVLKVHGSVVNHLFGSQPGDECKFRADAVAVTRAPRNRASWVARCLPRLLRRVRVCVLPA